MFRLGGESHERTESTVLLFGYDKFQVREVAAYASRYSFFSVMTVMIMLCAAVNNFGLFEIFFPEKLDEDDPAQLVPSPALTMTCGRCCICCNPKETADLESN